MWKINTLYNNSNISIVLFICYIFDCIQSWFGIFSANIFSIDYIHKKEIY